MVLAHHLMWTLYGWWLPNDPRGSHSRFIESDVLHDLGELHFGRKRVQPAGKEVRAFYKIAADRLAFPLLKFDPTDFPAVASAIGAAVTKAGYTCWARAVMPDHIHILVRKHRDLAEEMIEKLQIFSRSDLINAGMREPVHPTWTNGGWKVFLDSPADIERTIHYVEQNPVKRGWPIQQWDCVKPYDGWPYKPRR